MLYNYDVFMCGIKLSEMYLKHFSNREHPFEVVFFSFTEECMLVNFRLYIISKLFKAIRNIMGHFTLARLRNF